ncbi:hypothetical protein [Labrys miyagiensis]|nr:hypothetical protein [Labrys miyagiensis]
MTGETSHDPAIVAWRSWRSASRRAHALCRKQQRLETQLACRIGFPSVTLDDPALDEPVRIRSLRAFEALASSVPSVRHMRAFVEAELSAHHALWEDADGMLGYSAALQEEKVAMADEQRLADELFDADAMSIPGVLAKLEALIALDAPSEHSDERPWPQLRRIRAELTRLLERQARQTV